MNTSKLFYTVIFCLSFFYLSARPANQSKDISVPFNSMTFGYLGKKQKNNQSGKIIFEPNRLVMQGGNSKEAFEIIKINQTGNILSIYTQNNRNEKASFYFSFSGDKINKININMFEMEGYIEIGTNFVTKSNLFTLYKNQISSK